MSKLSSLAVPDRKLLALLLAQTDWLDQQCDAMVGLMIQLCNNNSGTLNLQGLQKVRQQLVDEYSALGGDLKILDIDPLETVDEHGNLASQELGKLIHINNRRSGCPTALLCIHMDTVYPADSQFQRCKTLDDGRICGPGVADAKGGLVVMLYALKALQKSEFAEKIGWEVIINPDEELGSPGSESFLKERARQADFGLLFEPTLPNGDFVSARKGVGNFTFVVRGRSAHSGREFDKGRNAIVCCCQLMNEIHQLNQNSDVTFNVGRINGGNALNVVPDLAIGRINVRVESKQQMEWVDSIFDQIVARYSGLDGFDVKREGRFTSPPKELTPEIECLQTLVEKTGLALGQEISWQMTGGASDGNKFASAGLPNIDTLGPLGGSIHSHAEFVVPESLVLKSKHTAMVLMAAAAAWNSRF